MRKVLLIACAVLISGCETAPPTIEYTFEEFQPIEAEPVSASALPSLTPLECYPDEEDCLIAGYRDGEDIDSLEAYQVLAEANTEIANENAQALEIMLEREQAILAAAKAQESVTRLREEQLAYERSERLREKWYYRIMIVLVGAAGVAAAD